MKTAISNFIAQNKVLSIILGVVLGGACVMTTMKQDNNDFSMQRYGQPNPYGAMQNGRMMPQRGNMSQRGMAPQGAYPMQGGGGYGTSMYGAQPTTGYYGSPSAGGYSSDNSFTNSWYKNQDIQDGRNEAFSDYLRGQDKVQTADGSVYSVESGYNQTFVNPNSSESYQTNDWSSSPSQISSGYEATTPYSYSAPSSSYSTTSTTDGGE